MFVKVPLPLITVHVPCTLGYGSTAFMVAEVPQTEKSAPASASVAGGVTWMEKP